MFKSLFSFVVDKTRLFIEYVLIGVVVSLAGIAVTLWMQNKNVNDSLDKLNTNYLALETKNTVQDKTIEDLKELRTRDATAIDGLINDYKLLAENSSVVRDQLDTLEKTNAEVRVLLNQPLPAALKCVLDKTCKNDNGSRIPKATPVPHGTLRPGD